jgi:hypothetical protein
MGGCSILVGTMLSLIHGLRASRSFVVLALAATPLIACQSTPDTNPGDGSSSSGGPTTGSGETTATTATSSSSGASTGAVVDDSGTSTGTSDTGTSTEGPEPEPVCRVDACFEQCTQELHPEMAKDPACTCVTQAVPAEWVECNLPSGCGGLNDYTCILEGLRDGVTGRYIWSYIEPDTGGETVAIDVVEPGRARALVSTFMEFACCGVQSTDAGQYHFLFDLPAPDDPRWETCLALAPEIEPTYPVPDCLRPEELRVGECTEERLSECPAG